MNTSFPAPLFVLRHPKLLQTLEVDTVHDTDKPHGIQRASMPEPPEAFHRIKPLSGD
jgi:hypothetical protein